MGSFADIVSSYLPEASPQAAEPAGLFITNIGKLLPMKSREVWSTVHCDTCFASTREAFTFISDEDVSVVFKFPLPPRSAVYKILAKVADRIITTEVKPKEEAEEDFATALSQGHTAVLTKQEKSSQIYTLELGNLEAMTEAVVEVSYLCLLDSVGGALEYVHTSTWTPPYTGSKGDQAGGQEAIKEQNPRFAHQISYKLSYDVCVVARQGQIREVECLHPGAKIQDLTGGEGTGKRVTLSEEVADASKDLTILVERQQEGELPGSSPPGSCSCPGGWGHVSIQECERPAPGGEGSPVKKTVALATFVPSAANKGQEGGESKVEIILVVDCSGSMEGSRIEQAKEAALFFVKDLPVGKGIYFNVVAFGSTHVSWSKSGCKEYKPDTMADAVAWVQKTISADMGGTEILSTFQDIYSTPIASGYTRQIIFLTDGGISSGEEQRVFELMSSTAASSQSTSQLPPAVLCLGIGHGVHRGLLDGMASRSGGVAQYVVDGEPIARKAGFLKKCALSATWGGDGVVVKPQLVARNVMIRAAPFLLPPRLFPGEPLHILVEVVKREPTDAVLELQGQMAGGRPFSLAISLDTATQSSGEDYAVLHAMCWVGSLLGGTSPLHVRPDGEPLDPRPSQQAVREAVVRAACQEGLVTPYTAAVGVMLQQDPVDPTQVKKIEVPLVVPHGAVHFDKVGRDEILGKMRLFGGGFDVALLNQQMTTCAMVKGRRGGAGFGLQAESMAFCKVAKPRTSVLDTLASALRGTFGGWGKVTSRPPPPGPGSAYAATSRGPGSDVPVIGPPLMGVTQDDKDEACLEEDTAHLVEGVVGLEVEMEVNQVEDEDSAPGLFSSASEVVTMLNLKRTIDGSWQDDDELLYALVGQRVRGAKGQDGGAAAAAMEVRSAKPAELSPSQWVTVVALAYLRKYCGSSRAVWEGMETKALSWLGATWPQGVRAPGVTILNAMKLI